MKCPNCGTHDDLYAYRIEWCDHETGSVVVRAFFACPQCSQRLPEWPRAPSHDIPKTSTLSGAAHELKTQLRELLLLIRGK